MVKFISTLALTLLIFCSLLGQGENLFDDSYLHEIHFEEMDTALITGNKIYQMVKMTFDGELVDSIGIKDKGNISNGVPNLKLPFKVKTNKYVSGKKYDGIKEFTLHNNFQDPTMMREKITYDICGQLGLFSLRTAFAKVFVNNKYWGLYTIVEGKDEMFKQQFDHRDADAIESLDFGNMCYLSDNPADYNFEVAGYPYYQLENGNEETAFDRFAVMIDKANNTSDADYLNEVNGQLNLEDFFKYQAANVYLMNFDSYIGFLGNQIYMYDTVANIWQIIPWDFNASLNLWDNGMGDQTAGAYPLLPSRIANGCIAEKLNTIPELKKYYLQAMCDMANNYADTMTILNQIDFLKNQIQTAVYEDWRKVYSNNQFDQTTGYGNFSIDNNQFEGLKTFFTERNNFIKSALDAEDYNCMLTSMEETEIPPVNFSIFPNPTAGFFQIEFEHPIDEISIYDIQGKLTRSINHPNSGMTIDLLHSGMYIIHAKSQGMLTVEKLIVD